MDKLEEAIGQLAVSGRETAKRPEDRLERRLEHILEMILKELKELVLSGDIPPPLCWKTGFDSTLVGCQLQPHKS